MSSQQIQNFKELNDAKGLKMVHLNIRSLLPKIDQLRLALQNSKIQVVTFSETWLHPHLDSTLINIPGYKTFRIDRDREVNKPDKQNSQGKKRQKQNKNDDKNKTARKRKKGGGLVTYVNAGLAAEVRPLDALNTMTKDLESQWIEIDRENARNIIICNMYRPPAGDIDIAISTLNRHLASLNLTRKYLFILGDFNIDFQNKSTPASKKLLFFQKSNCLDQLITSPTRITKTSSTSLDLIFTTANYISTSGTLNTFISDHQPVFLIKKKGRANKDREITQSFWGRSRTRYDPNTFKNTLRNVDWTTFYEEIDIDKKWEMLYKVIEEELDKQCPIKKFKFHSPKPPYFTNDIINQIRDRDYFYKKAKKLGNEDDWNIAKHLRNQTNRDIRRAKSTFVIYELQNSQDDSSKFWRVIKSVFPNKLKVSKVDIKLKDGTVTVPPDKTAEYINSFFINVGNLTQTPPPNSPNAPPQLNRQHQGEVEDNEGGTENGSLCHLEQVTQTDVFNITKKLNTRKSSGLLNMDPSILKDCLLVLNEQFTHVINTSLGVSSIPAAWKKAKVVPIPKTGDSTLVTNYRPISLLPSPGKILEKLVHTQLDEYLQENEGLTEFQYGFRKERATTNAITQLLNHTNINLNKKTPTLALFIDFKKAFDCLQYPVLLHKLRELNFAEETLQWIRNYLMDRQQCTVANGYTSSYADVTQGVPQGSILGPLLYIIYANDLAQTMKHTKFAFYADDTVLYTSNKNLNRAFRKMQGDLKNLSNWCTKNGIYVNPRKTKYMIFSNKHINTDRKNLYYERDKIERVLSFNYLGVILDQHLTFEKHAKNIINRTTMKIYQLFKLRKFLTSKAALMIYKNMILPIIEYGNIYMSSASKEHRRKIQVLQNKALKCALGKEKRYNTIMLHREAKLLKLHTRRKIHLIQHMFQQSRKSGFKGWKTRTGMNTRSSTKNLMKLIKPNTTKFQNSITYRGPHLWNTLPADLQSMDKPILFKTAAIKHITERDYKRALEVRGQEENTDT